MADGMLSLSWNNHKATFCHILTTLREKERFTDATVACEGRFYQVHKLVLSTCSEYFEKMFDNTPCKHPVIVLKDIASDELEALLSYMYDGVVSVAQNDLARLIKAAEVLRIKGLAVPDEPPPQRNDVSSNRRSAPSRNASDDRSSPHPKRRRRDENVPSQIAGHSSPISSPRASPAHSDTDPSRTQTDTRWSEHSEDKSIDRNVDERLHPSTTSSGSQQGGEVIVDETLVKEEIEDSTDNRDDMLDSGMDYGSLGSDSRLDGSLGGDGDNSSQMTPNKFEKSSSQNQVQNQQLPEAVVEALAGPSGMQGWLGGCEAPGGFSGMEGYSGEGSSQDMHPPQQGPPGAGVQSQAHQMVGLGRDILVSGKRGGPLEQPATMMPQPQMTEAPNYPKRADDGQNLTQMAKNLSSPMKLHHCRYCNYTTNFTTNLINHMRTHTGEKPFSCPHCPYRANQRTNLTMHMRTHTGEKPYACEFCPYRSTRKDALRTHMLRHTTLSNVLSSVEDLTSNF